MPQSLRLAAVLLLAALPAAAVPVVWKLDDPGKIGGVAPIVLGAPVAQGEGAERTLHFDGAKDGVDVPANPIKGWSRFTVQVLLSPDLDGKPEQRFFHIQQDNPKSRLLLEIRLTPQGTWSLDTFLEDGPVSLPLLDRGKQHPAGRWAWAALVYDGEKMTSYVDGVRQLQGPVAFRPMASGHTTIGVRINRVYWFKGRIREARFSPEALPPEKLEKPPVS